MNRYLIFAGIAVLAAVLGFALRPDQSSIPGDTANGTATAPATAPVSASLTAVADPVLGEILYQEGCAVCHGVNLEGQPDWQSPGEDGLLPAPPHDKSGHTWHHDDELLFSYTKFGGKETLARMGLDLNSGMPGFGDQLSDQQIWDILAYIKSTWPDRERQAQEQRNEAKRLQQEEN